MKELTIKQALNNIFIGVSQGKYTLEESEVIKASFNLIVSKLDIKEDETEETVAEKPAVDKLKLKK